MRVCNQNEEKTFQKVSKEPQRGKPAIEKEIEKRSIAILESDGREIKDNKQP